MIMTQEDKELLFQDLCVRLPYHVRCKVWLKDGTTEEGSLDLAHNYADVLRDAFYYNKIKDIKPYLRPMSSMTEEEKEEIALIRDRDFQSVRKWFRNESIKETGNICPVTFGEIDYCNKKHLDYRDLISMGLALEAKEEMYETEKQKN